MQTECSADLFGFAPVEGRQVVAGFDGGRMTSEAGAMLLGDASSQLRLVERFAGCFTDHRAAELVEHTVPSLVGQRVFGIALGYEDLIDHDQLRHDQLRHDPVMAVLGGKLAAKRADCAPLAGKSTLNRLELSRPEPTRYHKISYDAAAVEALFVDLFLDAHTAPPPQITLDPGLRRGRLSTPPTTRCTGIRRSVSSTAITTTTAICRSMCSAAGICWRPNCARPTSTAALAASRRSRGSSPASASAGPTCAFSQRAHSPNVRILLRADSGFAREALMAWCENNGVDFLLGLAKNARLNAEIEAELAAAQEHSQRTGKPVGLQPTA